MKVTTERLGGVAVVSVDGPVDAGSVEGLRSELDALVARGEQRLVVDLTLVPFMDSSGMATLVQTFKRVRIGEGDVRLAGAQEGVQRIFSIVRLDRVFEMHPDVEAAVASFDLTDEQ